MGYRVDYQPVRKVRGAEKQKSRVLALTALFFLLFCILISIFQPKTAQIMQELLIPGEAAVTVAAMERLAEGLKAGESFYAALEVFCQQIR